MRIVISVGDARIEIVEKLVRRSETTEVAIQVVLKTTFRGDHQTGQKAQQTLGFRRAGEGT